MTAPQPQTAPQHKRFRGVGLIFIALFAAIGSFAVWAIWFRNTTLKTDPIAAAQANTRGIGQMEQFEYAKAVPEFEEAVRHAPDWIPARINLGIALYNSTQSAEDPVLDRAIGIFQDVLKLEPDNPYAHYNLGMILLYRNQLPEAAPHFEAVARIDPQDAHAWYQRGVTHPQKNEAPEAKEFFKKALELNPYLNAARYALAQHTHERDEAHIRKLLDEHRALVEANWELEYSIKYSEMGKYAEVIGRTQVVESPVGPIPLFEKDDQFRAQLAEGSRWAKSQELDDLPRAVRTRFGGTIVRLDYDQDKKTDLLLLSAVNRQGKIADLLLHHEGNQFTDVSTQMGLNTSASLGCVVADFDNDSWPDLFLTTSTGIRFLRNEAGKRYVDRTDALGLNTLTGVFLSAAALDLDQDGDLDILLARLTDTPLSALARLAGQPAPAGELVILANTSVAPPAPAGSPAPALELKFQREQPKGLEIRGALTTLVCSDLDADYDVDLIGLCDDEGPNTILNDRLLRFRSIHKLTAESQRWNGGLVLDANRDEQSDIFLIADRKKPTLLISASPHQTTDFTKRFQTGFTDSPPLLQAQMIDLDLDNRSDVVGLSVDHKPVLLQGHDKGQLKHIPGAFGQAADQIPHFIGVAILNLEASGNQDLICWSEEAGLVLFRNRGNGHQALILELTGRRDKGSNLRTNSDGIGARAMSLSGSESSSMENTTLSAGLGQSRTPIVLGLKKSTSADLVKIRWPDGVPQGELNIPAGRIVRIEELNRKGTSCPILFTWDGTRFQYVTDFLGGGALGEVGPDGSVRPPRSEESVKIEASQLLPRNGKYVIKIAEPMDEVLYLDHLKLEVIDHPKTTVVFPDERFSTGGPAPTQELLAFPERIGPQRARNHRGDDVLATIRERDAKFVDQFAPRSWLGYAEDHFVELDFGNQLNQLPPGKRAFLILSGWIDYPYPESIYAASQAGVEMKPPVLECLETSGKWAPIADLGFPAGLPKTMTFDITQHLGSERSQFRIRTNLQVYWDQITIGFASPAPVKSQTLEVSRATLSRRGFAQEIKSAHRGPIAYNDDHTETVMVTHWKGRFTKPGNVTPLLTASDDRFILCGPGDEIVVEFDANSLSPLKPNHDRSFVLRTHGYCKDTSPFTLTGGQVHPLPYRGMSSYPHGANDRSKAPRDQEAYDREWNALSPDRR